MLWKIQISLIKNQKKNMKNKRQNLKIQILLENSKTDFEKSKLI